MRQLCTSKFNFITIVTALDDPPSPSHIGCDVASAQFPSNNADDADAVDADVNDEGVRKRRKLSKTKKRRLIIVTRSNHQGTTI